MIEHSTSLLTESLIRSGRTNAGSPHRSAAEAVEAGKLYRRARFRARWRALWARLVSRLETRLPNSLLGRSPPLWDLHRLSRQWTILNCFDEGVQTVALDLVCGSEGRCRDFDGALYPRQDHSKTRWLGVATARLQGQPLPPVSLVRVGAGAEARYFVRDGHHRLSVARALEQPLIEATVTVWRVDGPLPWCRASTAGQNAALEQLTVDPAR
ncbi:MAG: hypothetical protein R3300_03760 [Candidatus Promineifilaceae bacterium]|nr:hypothetical protein [Candidatus Promineifilaceae bacterium]